jgi:cell division protein FtsL
MRRVVNVLALVLLAALAVGLYRAKTEADDDRRRVRALEAELAQERESVRVMRNEVGYLESPERLRTLAEEQLGLAPIDPLRVVTLEDAPLLIEPPTLQEASPAEVASYSEDEAP